MYKQANKWVIDVISILLAQAVYVIVAYDVVGCKCTSRRLHRSIATYWLLVDCNNL